MCAKLKKTFIRKNEISGLRERWNRGEILGTEIIEGFNNRMIEPCHF